MADIDLIPANYRAKRTLRRRSKWFVAALVAVLCALGASRATLFLAVSNENGQIAQLRKSEQDSTQVRARLQDYEQQKAAAEKQLKALDDLRGRNRISLLLEAVDSAYVGGVWLDEMRFSRPGALPGKIMERNPAASGVLIVVPQPGQPAPAQDTMRAEQRVELTGHAADHSHLASFMSRLGAQPTLADVQLLDTSSRVYSTATVVDFKVSFAIIEGRPR